MNTLFQTITDSYNWGMWHLPINVESMDSPDNIIIAKKVNKLD